MRLSTVYRESHNIARQCRLEIGTTAYTMSSGAIPLLPYDTVKFSAAPAVFKWLGK
jgi:hypothetical protein